MRNKESGKKLYIRDLISNGLRYGHIQLVDNPATKTPSVCIENIKDTMFDLNSGMYRNVSPEDVYEKLTIDELTEEILESFYHLCKFSRDNLRKLMTDLYVEEQGDLFVIKSPYDSDNVAHPVYWVNDDLTTNLVAEAKLFTAKEAEKFVATKDPERALPIAVTRELIIDAKKGLFKERQYLEKKYEESVKQKKRWEQELADSKTCELRMDECLEYFKDSEKEEHHM